MIKKQILMGALLLTLLPACGKVTFSQADEQFLGKNSQILESEGEPSEDEAEDLGRALALHDDDNANEPDQRDIGFTDEGEDEMPAKQEEKSPSEGMGTTDGGNHDDQGATKDEGIVTVEEDKHQDDGKQDEVKPPVAKPENSHFTIDIKRRCSDDQALERSSVLQAEKVHLAAFDVKQNRYSCMDSEYDYKTDIINMDQLKIFGDCEFKNDQVYEIMLFDSKHVAADGDYDTFKSKGLTRFKVKVKDNELRIDEQIFILYGSSPMSLKYESAYEDHLITSCQDHASPLFVKLNNSEAVKFTAPLSGIKFDILGDRNDNVKKQISWADSSSIGFIVLPNALGEVNGINELFGDNTRGPDGSFSSDGYQALAKHNDNNDDVIDKNDTVFSKLRIWVDKDKNGQATDSELSTLGDNQIVSLPLKYDMKYSEKDKYGNKILFKSIAKTKDGGNLLVFDVWFRLIN